MSFAIGETVGPYRIMEQHGKGGMATVFKAYHAALDRYVALKVLHPAFKEDPNFLARFQREARVVAQLEHPNIVPIYDFAEHQGQPYLVMKFIRGVTLKARLARGSLTDDERTQVVEAVGHALAYAHERGILHRDIKPSNILLSEEGRIYLADFGLARIASYGASTLSADMLMGTPQYISPEQARGEKDLDNRTDIYSFGIVLYELLVGRVPFNADTPFSVVHDHIYKPLPLPREINPNLSEATQRVLLRALAKNREDRFENVEDLLDAYRQARVSPTPDQIAATQTAPQADARLQALHEIPEESVSWPEQEGTPSDEMPKGRKKIPGWIWITAGLLITCLSVAAFGIILRGALAKTADHQPLSNPASSNEVLLSEEQPNHEQAIIEAEDHETKARQFEESGDPQAAFHEWVAAGEHFLLGEAFHPAAKAFIRAIEIEGGASSVEPWLLDLANQAFFFGAARPDMLGFIEEAARTHPDWPILIPILARAYLHADRMDLAEENIQKAFDLMPEDFITAGVLAEMRFLEGNIDEALGILENVLRTPEMPAWYGDHARHLQEEIRNAEP